MAKIKITSNINLNIGAAITPSIAKQIEMVVKQGINEMLDVGTSPVRGYGRYEAYAAQRLDPKKYPNSVKSKYPNKKIRPVNLQLTGAMIKSIKVLSSSGDKVSIGIPSGKESLKAETHNEGTQRHRVPQRKFLPTGPGEEFVVSIQRKILAILEKAVSDRLKKP